MAKQSLSKPLCAPLKRLKAFTPDDFISFIKYHEYQADNAMGSLCCGSEKEDYREAHFKADAHHCAAALLRILIQDKVKTAV